MTTLEELGAIVAFVATATANQGRPAGEDGHHHHDADLDALQRDFENAVMRAIID